MQFLKNLSGGGIGAAKGAAAPSKPNYFASLKLEQQFNYEANNKKRAFQQNKRLKT